MGTIKRFEDLEIWQLARQVENRVYEEIQQGILANDKLCRNIFAFMDYLNKSAIKGQKFARRVQTLTQRQTPNPKPQI